VQEHVRQISAGLPPYKRVKVLHLWEHDLPRTSTRKVKRRLVVDELKKLQRAVAHAEEHPVKPGSGGDWVLDLVSRVSAKPRDKVQRETRLGELGVDSLMAAELAVALEAAGVAVEEQDLLQGGVDTVGALAELVAARQKKARARLEKPKPAPPPPSDELPVAAPLAALGRRVLRWGQRMTYERLFETKVSGSAYLPKRAPFIVAANHASHLDMGLVKHALGDWGELLVALAAKDYFFEDRLKRAYFENFTNLVPMDRSGSLRESLRLAADVLAEGKVLLIFPEGTRSPDGVMRDFKASVGYLALANHVDVVPMYLDGTYEALPKGAALPHKREIGCKIGPLITHQRLRAEVETLPRAEHNRAAARIIEAQVRTLGGLA
jgi:long-chain acyl-CoA synthetase